MAAEFVHLHTHSSYSPMWGVPTLEALCEAVQAEGQDTLALTDTNGLYGAVRFIEVAKQAGLKPILGAELVHQDHRAVVLAKTPDGYANLCRLLSARHEDTGFDFIKTVARYRAGLVILSNDLPALAAWRDDASDDLYVELSPGSEMQDALAFSRRMGVPPVATTRAALLRPSNFEGH
jgi:error-prone DNA polymerase